MRNGWQTKKLGELCEIELGRTPSRSNSSFWDEKRETSNVWLSIADLLQAEDNVVVDSKEYVSDKGAKICKLVTKGTLLVSFKLTLGRLAFAGRDLFTNEAIAALSIFDEREMSKEFLFYFLHFFDWIKAAENDVKLKGMTLNKAKLKEMDVHFPKTLAEQQRIVGLLDEAFAGLATAIDNAEKNLQNARAIFDSHFQSVLRNKKWKWKTLGDLCDDVEYGSSAKSKKEGKIPVLRMGNIQDGHLDWENLVYTDDKDEIEKYLLKHNDVLFNRTNSPELVGKTAIYKSEMPAIFAGYLIRIHRKEELLDADYLTYFLNSQIAFDYGKTVVISSVNQANINGTKLKTYPIPAPSLSEQKAIVATLNELSDETLRLESIYQRKLTALEALKKSLLHQAFNGELTKESAPQPAIVSSLAWLPPIPSVQNITPIDLQAGILAMAYQFHQQNKPQWDFGHVIGEKNCHMVESLVGVDLGRNPVQDPQGPDDFNHFKKVEHRAKMAGYFTFQKHGLGNIMVRGRGFESLVAKTRAALGDLNQKVDEVLKLMLPLNLQRSEVVATVYAAWNNLLLDGQSPTDEQIVLAARENWHPDKLLIDRDNFFKTIDWLRKKNICPQGTGKRVLPKIT